MVSTCSPLSLSLDPALVQFRLPRQLRYEISIGTLSRLDHVDFQGMELKNTDRTNHNQGARHRHALPGTEPLRVGAPGYDQRS